MTPQTSNVSVTVPVTQAIEHAKRVLFNPFDPGKWFAIGFCAWLARLGQTGFGGSYRGGGRPGNMNVQDAVQRARDFITNNLYWLIPVAIVVVVLGIALGVLIVWLSSRGKFMFLHCVALDRAEIIVPWHKFACEATSLFWFRLVLGLIQFTLILPILGVMAALIWPMIQRGAPTVGGIVAVAGLALVLMLMCLAFWVVHRLITDFVVPIMFLRRGTCLNAWGVLRQLLAANPGGFVLYFLFRILLSMAIGACVLALILVTCCLAGCLLAIPYLGTVLFLPVLVFQRGYSVFYLRQYGPDYDVFASSAGPTAVLP